VKLLTIHRELKGVPVDIVFHDDGTLELISDYDVEPDIAAEALGLAKSEYLKLMEEAAKGWSRDWAKPTDSLRPSPRLLDYVKRFLVDAGHIPQEYEFSGHFISVSERPPGPWDVHDEDASLPLTDEDVDTLNQNVPTFKYYQPQKEWPEASGLIYWPAAHGFVFFLAIQGDPPANAVAWCGNEDDLSDNLVDTLQYYWDMGFDVVEVQMPE
jgi:hypothetical protein